MILYKRTTVTLGICTRSECRCESNTDRLNCRKYIKHQHHIECVEADRVAAECERGHG